MSPKLLLQYIQEENIPPDQDKQSVKLIKKEDLPVENKRRKDYMRDYLTAQEIEEIISNKKIKIEYND
jgi:hypothetical protein